MAHIINEDAIIDGVRFKEQGGNPDTPASGFDIVFTKSNGLYIIDDGGNVTGPLGTGGGSSLEVKEIDGSPDVSNVSIIRVSNGTLTSDGGGQVTITTGGAVSDGDKGDVVVSGSGAVWTIDNGVVSNAKLADVPTDTIKGRATASTGVPEDLTALPFAFTGDVTRPADSNAQTIANNAVTFAKMQAITDGKLLGASGGTAIEEIGVSTGLQLVANNLSSTITQYTDEMAQDAVGTILVDTATVDLTYNDGTPSITADVINDSITYAKIQNISAASRLLGRGSAGGAGDTQELDLGAGLSISGTTLSGTGGGLVLDVNTTPVGNVGAGEDNLITYTVPANTLDTNGQFIQFQMAGIFAASINTKRIRVYFGSALLLDTGALAITGAGDWSISGYIIRTGSATQRCIAYIVTNEAALLASSDYVDATEDLTGTVVLKATGEAASDNDIVQKFQIAVKGGGSGGGSGSADAPQSATIWGDEMLGVVGTWGVIDDSAQRFTCYLQNSTAGNGDQASFPIALKAGTYTLFALGVTFSSFGITDMAVDGGTPVSMDWYSGGAVRNVIKSGSITVATNGNHTLTITMNGKNGSSSNFACAITKIWIR